MLDTALGYVRCLLHVSRGFLNIPHHFTTSHPSKNDIIKHENTLGKSAELPKCDRVPLCTTLQAVSNTVRSLVITSQQAANTNQIVLGVIKKIRVIITNHRKYWPLFVFQCLNDRAFETLSKKSEFLDVFTALQPTWQNWGKLQVKLESSIQNWGKLQAKLTWERNCPEKVGNCE